MAREAETAPLHSLFELRRNVLKIIGWFDAAFALVTRTAVLHASAQISQKGAKCHTFSISRFFSC